MRNGDIDASTGVSVPVPVGEVSVRMHGFRNISRWYGTRACCLPDSSVVGPAFDYFHIESLLAESLQLIYTGETCADDEGINFNNFDRHIHRLGGKEVYH